MATTNRFWVISDQEDVAQSTDQLPWGDETAGIADEAQGGISLYCHRDSAEQYAEILNQRVSI